MATVGIGGSRLARAALVLLLAAGGMTSPAIGQVGFGGGGRSTTKVYFDKSTDADNLLRSADGHAKSGDFAEAVEIYQRVIQQFGDKVVAVPVEAAGNSEDSRLSVNARRECQRRISALPPQAREIYRARVDSQAERWFTQGKDARDLSSLRKVVDQAICSSWGDDALDLLGDLAFQDGQFAEALAAYTQLLPDRIDPAQVIVHPDGSVDLARVAAKKLLCRAAIGDRPPTLDELKGFAAAHPGDSVQFAGRRGPLSKLLAEAVRDDHLAPPAEADGRWPTFAGAPTRDRVAPGAIDVGSLQWRVELEPINPMKPGGGGFGMGRRPLNAIPASSVPGDRLLAYHPIVVGDQVIVCDDKHVTAFNLNSRPMENSSSPTGLVETAWKTPDLMGSMLTGKSVGGLARYTLTAQGNRLFARIGSAPSTMIVSNRNMMGPRGAEPSLIVALDRTTGEVLWRREASDMPLPRRKAEVGNKNIVFEGSPVADGRNVYVAMTDRIEMTTTYVACLDARNGDVRWVRYICEANANVDQFMSTSFEISHRLLTLDGPTLYYQTNLGAVASLDAETGGVRWLATYPWTGRNGGGGGGGHERDLNPAVVHDGLVIVAPDDTPSIYAFDAGTGRLAWKTEPIRDEVKLSHLLGVAKGHLIATGDRVLWIDVKTGKLAHEWPDNAASVQGFGRGVLAGDRIYWPTETEIHILDQASGLKAEAPIKLQETYQCKGGNLAIGDGYLIVAQANSLVVFCQNSRLIDRYRDEIARTPEQASNYYRLAQAAEAIGRDELALESLAMTLDRSRPSESIDGIPLGEATRDHQRRLLMKLGQKARAASDWPGATRRFTAAAAAARSDRDRLAARLELAEVQLSSGEPRASVATLQALLADERLRSLSVDAADGHRSVRADLLIADRLAGLIREKGRGLYAEFDREAADLVTRGQSEHDPRLLEDVGRAYPSAKVVPEAWLALGGLYDASGRPGDAARAYKRLLAVAPDDATRARALCGLAAAYEAQKLWGPARDTYQQALARFADQHVDALGPGAIRSHLVDRLGREPLSRLVGDEAEPNMPLPLRRRWDRHWADAARPIGVEGIPPAADSARVFLVQGRMISPVDPATGASIWSRDVEGETIWVGYMADRVIAATRTRLVALSLEKGTVEWQYDLGAATLGKPGANPFVRELAAEAGGGDPALARLQDFRIVGNRIFCLKGDQAVLAFDGDSGLIDWSYSPASGRINPKILIGPRRIVLQVRKPNAMLVLDTATGRREFEYSQAEDDEWPRTPLAIDDDHVGLVTDRLTVALFDLRRGRNAWTFRESIDQPKYGPPRLMGDADRLLVLHDGRELIRLDAATGTKGWSRLVGTEDIGERPEAIAMGDDRVFVANTAELSALSMGDGSTIWKRPLTGPASGWAVALTDRSVAAYPNPARLQADDLHTLPLFLCRRDDGELIQRLLFPAPITDLAIRFSPRGALVATQGGLWALGERQGMDGPKGPR